VNNRVAGVRVAGDRGRSVIAIAAGAAKLPALRAGLAGRIFNGLVTDEPTAAALLAD
jgi:DNA-binding transcriptional regulator LsrR (DeoR family)